MKIVMHIETVTLLITPEQLEELSLAFVDALSSAAETGLPFAGRRAATKGRPAFTIVIEP